MANENQLNNGDSVTGGEGTPSAAGAANEQNGLTLEQINELTGRNFETREQAQDALKSTFDFVGKAGSYNTTMKQLREQTGKSDAEILSMLQAQSKGSENNVKDVDTSNLVTRDQYERDMFYKDNPQLAAHRTLIDDIARSRNVSPREAVAMDDVKQTLESLTDYADLQQRKSVLESNPRLGAAVDKSKQADEYNKQAREALVGGNIAESNRLRGEANRSAVEAVIEAYDLDK